MTLIKKRKKVYYNNFIGKNTRSMKLLWEQINNLINKTEISCIKMNDFYETNPDKISNKFNNYPSSIA